MHISHRFNTVVGLAGLLALALSATLAYAETQETIKIKLRSDSGLNDAVVLENLEVGATEVVVTAGGDEALVTRTEQGVTIEIAGESIEVALPAIESLHGEHDHNVFVLGGDGEVETVDRKVLVLRGDNLEVDHPDHKRVIIKRLHRGGDMDEIDVEALLEELNADDIDLEKALQEELNIDIDLELEGEGKKVIWIQKRVEVDGDENDN